MSFNYMATDVKKSFQSINVLGINYGIQYTCENRVKVGVKGMFVCLQEYRRAAWTGDRVGFRRGHV